MFTNEEVRDAKVELFFDDESREGVVVAKGHKLTFVYPSGYYEGDAATFTARIVDQEDIKKVKSLFDSMSEGEYPGSNVTFGVSHPHGTLKKVSFGTIEEVFPMKMVSVAKYGPFYEELNAAEDHDINESVYFCLNLYRAYKIR